jgi:hypothetical protein
MLELLEAIFVLFCIDTVLGIILIIAVIKGDIYDE